MNEQSSSTNEQSSSTNKKLVILFLTLIVALGLFLRLKNHALVPSPGDSVDEYSFAWLGLSLIENGTPTATSGLSPYHHLWKYINVDNFYQRYYTPNPFPIDQPWFDHPPLFSLIPGGFAYLRGVRDFADTSVTIIRKPMVAVGIVNLLLVFWLASLVFNQRVALITSLLYASEPLVVISSRLVQAENFLITLFLLSLISLILHHKAGKGVWFWLAISLSGLATLVKLSGWSVALSLILIILILNQKGRFQKSSLIFMGTFLIFLFFPLFGLIFDGELFKQVLLENSARFYRDGVSVIYNLLFKQNITRDFLSGWITLGWISTVLLLPQLKNQTKLLWVVIPTISYLLIYLILGSESYGWYKFPFFPFLTIAIGYLIVETFQSPNFFYNLFLVFLPGAIMLNRFLNAESLQAYIWPFRLFIILLFAVLLLPWVFPKDSRFQKIYQLTMVIIFLGLIILNIYTVVSVTPERWDNLNWLHSI